MDDDNRLVFLKDEYLLIQSMIHDYDGRTLTIKAWSVSFSLVAIGGAFATNSSAVLLVSAFSALLFWFIEAIWKSTQYAFYERSGKLERFFAGELLNLDPLQIGSSWYSHYSKGDARRLISILIMVRVAIPHAAVALLGFVLYILVYLEIIVV